MNSMLNLYIHLEQYNPDALVLDNFDLHFTLQWFWLSFAFSFSQVPQMLCLLYSTCIFILVSTLTIFVQLLPEWPNSPGCWFKLTSTNYCSLSTIYLILHHITQKRLSFTCIKVIRFVSYLPKVGGSLWVFHFLHQ